MEKHVFGLLLVLAIGLNLGGGTSRADDAKPTAPADNAPTVGEVRTQTMKGFIFFYGKMHVSFLNMADKLGIMIPQLKREAERSHAKVAGSLIFIYQGMTPDPTAEFDLEVGFPIEEKIAAAGLFSVRDVPEYHCLSVLFTGTNDQFSAAYAKLMPVAMQPNVNRTGESREIYMYYEDAKSPNNVVHVSIGIK